MSAFELSSYTHDKNDEETTMATRPSLPFQRHFGNNWTFFFYKNEPLITIGPHWPLTFCMIATFSIASFFLLKIMALKQSKYPALYFFSWGMVLLLNISYLVTALKNPGIVTGDSFGQGILQCPICNNHRDKGSLFHCDDCDVCVRGFDHHCPWTGKCIAKGNLKPFYVFITMIPIFLVYFIF